jgi:uncharacterized membrane protein YdjX (TVP38/TMEM64 family)
LAPVQPEKHRALARLAAFGVLLCGLFVVGLLMAPHSAHRLRRDLDGLGAWGPLAAIALSALLTCAFVPGPVLAGASGLLFGTAVGTAVAIVSATLGASAAFGIGRRLAQKPYGALVRGRLRVWTARVEGRGFLAVLYARIAPGAPFALISYAAGLTRIGLGAFAAGTATGAFPRAFAYAALGGTLGDYTSPQALVAIGVLVAMAIGGAALLWRSRSNAAWHEPHAENDP